MHVRHPATASSRQRTSATWRAAARHPLPTPNALRRTCQHEVLHAGGCVRPVLLDAHVVACQAAAHARLNKLIAAALSLQAGFTHSNSNVPGPSGPDPRVRRQHSSSHSDAQLRACMCTHRLCAVKQAADRAPCRLPRNPQPTCFTSVALKCCAPEASRCTYPCFSSDPCPSTTSATGIVT